MKSNLFIYILLFVALIVGNLILSPIFLKEYRLFQFCVYSLFLLFFIISNFRYQLIPSFKKQSLLEKSFSLLLFWSFCSIFWATHKGMAVYSTQNLLIVYLFYFVFKKYFLSNRQKFWQMLLPFTSILTVVVLGHTLYQFWDIKTSTIETIGGIYPKNLYDFMGLVGHKNTVAALLFLLIPFNIVAFIQSNRNYRILVGVTLSLSFLSIFLLESRSVFIALVGALLSGGILWFRSRKESKVPMNNRRFATTALLIVGLIGSAVLMGSATFEERMNIINWTSSRSFSERILLWQKTGTLIQNNLLKGVGQGNWFIEFPSVGLDGLVKVELHNKIFGHPHNEFLVIFSELGIIGFLLFCLLWASILFKLSRFIISTNDPKERLIGILLFATIVGYLIVLAMTTTAKLTSIQLVFFLLLAWCHTLIEPAQTNKNESTSLQWSNLFWLILLLGNLTVFTARIQEQRSLQNLEKQLEEVPAKPTLFSSYTQSIFTTYFKTANQHLKNKDYTQAIENYKMGLSVNPYHTVYLTKLGEVFFRQKNYEEAVIYFKKALAVNPKYERAIFRMAKSYIELKDVKKARHWTRKLTSNKQLKQKLAQEIRDKF